MRLLPTGLVLLPLLALPVQAGSVTADSINDRSAARQEAIQQIPRGASVTRTECQDIQVGGFGLPRYRCTVWYTDPAATPASAPSQPPASAPAP